MEVYRTFRLISAPYVTSYPIITTRGRTSEAFMVQEGFFIKYILKFPPGTMGTYQFRVREADAQDNPTSHLKLCKLQVQHIGANMPCTRVPTQAPTDYDSIIYWNNNTDSAGSICGAEPSEGGVELVVSDHFAEGELAKASHGLAGIMSNLQGLTNWGQGTLSGNLNPDENSVTVMAYFQVCAGLDASVENVSVHYELKAKSDGSGTDGIPFSTADIYTHGLYDVIKLDPLTANDQVPYENTMPNPIG